MNAAGDMTCRVLEYKNQKSERETTLISQISEFWWCSECPVRVLIHSSKFIFSSLCPFKRKYWNKKDPYNWENGSWAQRSLVKVRKCVCVLYFLPGAWDKILNGDLTFLGSFSFQPNIPNISKILQTLLKQMWLATVHYIVRNNIFAVDAYCAF